MGQNFLVDEFVVEDICDVAEISKEDLIIEIGPGIGTLTATMVEKAGKVISIEVDDKMVTVLEDRFKFYDNFELIHDDVLNVDLTSLIKKNLNKKLTTCKIVANLPYYITTPIIVKILEDKLPLESITIMVQKEVAERLTAIPGSKSASSISYLIYYYTDSEIKLNVFKDSFIPKPKVDSSVVNMKFLKEPRVKVKNEKEFFNIIKKCFSQKRKTLVNSLINNQIFSTREEAENALTSIGLDTKTRSECLTLQDFCNLYSIIIGK